jgi:hypothetical protein
VRSTILKTFKDKGVNMFKEFNEAASDIKQNVKENFLSQKINALKEGQIQSRQVISENEKAINILDDEIQRLTVLESRLKKIYSVRNFKDLGAALEVSILVNKINLRLFTERLNDLLGTNFQFSIEQTQLADLTLWQFLFLIFGDLDELNKKKSEPPKDVGAVDPEKLENSFDKNKRFGSGLNLTE